MTDEINEISDEKRHELTAEILRSLRSHGLDYCTARNILNESLRYLDRIAQMELRHTLIADGITAAFNPDDLKLTSTSLRSKHP